MGTPLTSHQKRLFAFLGVATFFEGYDFIAITQILPNLRAEFELNQFEGGLLIAWVNLGTIVAWPLVRRSDLWGRRRVLKLTILGYALFTLFSAFAWDIWSLALFQFLGRIFLIGEAATANVYAAEEYPSDRRGTVIGVLQGMAGIGGITCAGLAPIFLAGEYGWRSVYLAGVVPLLLLAVARRNLPETKRFKALTEQTATTGERLFSVMRGPYRNRVLKLALIWGITFACSNTAMAFWKDFALTERGMTDAQVGTALTIGALFAMPLSFGSGKLLDVVGRKWGSVVIFSCASAGVYMAYSAQGPGGLTVALIFAIFGVNSVLPALSALTTELFPTEIRADAYAWANNLLGRLGYVAAPLLVGWLAELYSWGEAIRPLAILPLIAVALIWLLLPETNGKSLEDTAKISVQRVLRRAVKSA